MKGGRGISFYFISQTDRAQRHKGGEHKTRVLKGNQIVSEIIFVASLFDVAKTEIKHFDKSIIIIIIFN